MTLSGELVIERVTLDTSTNILVLQDTELDTTSGGQIPLGAWLGVSY